MDNSILANHTRNRMPPDIIFHITKKLLIIDKIVLIFTGFWHMYKKM